MKDNSIWFGPLFLLVISMFVFAMYKFSGAEEAKDAYTDYKKYSQYAHDVRMSQIYINDTFRFPGETNDDWMARVKTDHRSIRGALEHRPDMKLALDFSTGISSATYTNVPNGTCQYIRKEFIRSMINDVVYFGKTKFDVADPVLAECPVVDKDALTTVVIHNGERRDWHPVDSCSGCVVAVNK